MQTVHQNGIAVHEIENPELVPLFRLLVARGYPMGDRREILAHTLAFGTIEGVIARDLLRHEDARDAELAIEEGLGEVGQADPAWGSPTGREDRTHPLDDCWTPNDTVSLIPPDLDMDMDEHEPDFDWPGAPDWSDTQRPGYRESLADAGVELVDPRLQARLDALAVEFAPRTLAETVDHEALAYRAWRTEVGDFLAGQMERLAHLIRFTGSETPEQFNDRFEVLELEARSTYYDRGRADGAAGTHSFAG